MTSSRGADFWIRVLALRPHPEGGHYREVYRSKETVPGRALPRRYGGPRAFSTSIYFLLKAGEASRFHRLKSDETWHFYNGGPLCLTVISRRGSLQTTILGRDPAAGEVLQTVLPRNSWFGAEVVRPGSFALVGCTVAPGFDFADLDLGRRETLLRRFPRHRAVIIRLT